MSDKICRMIKRDIENVTIKNILTDQQYNDLGFRIGNRVLLLLEAQSTRTVNIVVRIMMYLMQTYNDYCTENGLDLYGAKKVEFPKPELYVIFTGERKNHPEYISLKDVLADYLKEKEVEVMDIMTALFDEEEVSRRYHLRIERERSEAIARNLLAKGQMSVDDIADCTGLSVGEIEKIANLQLV